MANCSRCKRLEGRGGDRSKFYFCEYTRTYYTQYDIKCREDVNCDGFEEVRSRNNYPQNRPAPVKFLECYACGKIERMSIYDCYCSECKKVHPAIDNFKIATTLKDPTILRGICQQILSQAVSDYKALCKAIVNNPKNMSLYQEKYRLEDYFHSKQFRVVLEYTLDLEGELTEEDFHERANMLTQTIQKGARYYDDGNEPERELFE